MYDYNQINSMRNRARRTERISIMLSLATAFCLLSMLFVMGWLIESQSAAMRQCVETHSVGTCASILK